MNELHKETSPYLLQHATNPIHWKTWSSANIDKAIKQDKLLVISIGYSTCHWCHVMEEETFQDKAVAELMSENFVSIKVDREEHLDVDAYYMKAIQIMTQRGGWPLNVVCLPDGRPIWGGTYFPKSEWFDSLSQLATLYATKKHVALEYAEKLQQGITILSAAPENKASEKKDLTTILNTWKKSFDWEYGGYTRAPKFMMPTNLLYLQKHALFFNDKEILEYIDLTLQRLAWGGIFDNLEGGFSRYSVDLKWHVPHFEKMLYDNAQLLSVYADAYKRTHADEYRRVLEKTVEFIETNWKDNSGGYYSATNADSLDLNGQKMEGAYYVWTEEELRSILGEDYNLFSEIYNINSFGKWEEDNYVLIRNCSLEELANNRNITLEELIFIKNKAEAKLLAKRNERDSPSIDNKIVCSWNAMYILGLLDTYTALQDQRYLIIAQELFTYIERNFINEEEKLLHSITQGKKGVAAYLDDYAFFIQAAIALFEHTGLQTYLNSAKFYTSICYDQLYSLESGFFYFNDPSSSLVTPAFETEDNVIPSSNAIMALNLQKLGVLYTNSYYTETAKNMINIIVNNIDYASAYSHWLIAKLHQDNPLELTITGENALEKVITLRNKPITRSLIIPLSNHTIVPYLHNKETSDRELIFHLCENNTCLLPNKNEEYINSLLL